MPCWCQGVVHYTCARVRLPKGEPVCQKVNKIFFSTVVPRSLRMPKQVVLACFEPVVTCFSPPKIESGPFLEENRVKNGPKSHFSKSDPDSMGCLNTCFPPDLSSWSPVLDPNLLLKGLKMGHFRIKTESKRVQKHIVPQVDLDHLGC